LQAIGPKLSPGALRAELDHWRARFEPAALRLQGAVGLQLSERRAALTQAGKLLVSLSYRNVLARGYAVIKDADGKLVNQREGLMPGDSVAIEFADGEVGATIAGSPAMKKKPRPQADDGGQETLF